MFTENLSFDRFFAFRDLRGYDGKYLARDLMAALVVTFLAVPQGIAYAMIAGLPPMMGLYAAAIPTIVGSLFRSSNFVITGPTNAVSLLVAGGVATFSVMHGADPVSVAVSLALLVGLLQFFAGVLRLGALVDYISNPVVLGYITGAGLLIGVGQLHNVTGTEGGGTNAFQQIGAWVEGLGGFDGVAFGMAIATAAAILLLRKVNDRLPGAIIVLGGMTVVSWAFGLPDTFGINTVSDLTPVPRGLPEITVPDADLLPNLVGLALAATVLSLVESSAVAQSIAAKTGEKLDTSVEFAGQGLANIAAGFFGAYPTSGSLARSAVNHASNAATRLSGVFAGVLMLGVLLVLGPVVNQTPIAALAGLLLIVAADLVDLKRVKLTLRSPWADRFAFVATLVGTWALPLDEAIYLGVGISLVLFLRKARLLVTRELAVDADNRMREISEGDDPGEAEVYERCSAVRILHVEGHLFFGVVGELQEVLDDVIDDPCVEVLILRLKRTHGMDVTVAMTIADAARRMEAGGRHLLLAGVRPDTMSLLERTQLDEEIGRGSIFETRSKWFASLRDAVENADGLVGHEHGCQHCPIDRYLAAHDFLEPSEASIAE